MDQGTVIDWWLDSWSGRDPFSSTWRKEWLTITEDDWRYSTAPIIDLDALMKAAVFSSSILGCPAGGVPTGGCV